ncbi:MAG: hypothetical protein LBV69_06775 [Bacteroidales bacterium]|jgi:hypothetical protein|nr:hypothetical protein [Bacteroidales bacterium]
MVKIKFIVGLLIASPIIVCATANIPVAAKTNIAEQETKKINVTQKNTSTYMSELNSSTDLEL